VRRFGTGGFIELLKCIYKRGYRVHAEGSGILDIERSAGAGCVTDICPDDERVRIEHMQHQHKNQAGS